MELLDRFRGSLLGLAVGDALGHPTEFVASIGAIRERWGPQGITDFEPSGRHAAGTFTDDTQMAIAVLRALVRAGHRDLDSMMTLMGEEFVAWSRSPLNNRAPGGTCLAGCRALARHVAWREAGVKGSKGCGAAMRAAPVGLFLHHDVDAMVRVAAAQSALTHAHPTGVASSVAAAAPVAWAARGGSLEGGGRAELLAFTRDCVARLSPALLADVGCDPRMIERIGLREMFDALDRVAQVVDRPADDVCALLGGAWVGEEAVACALWCVLHPPGDFRSAVLRGANSSGDSDSIACIAGSIAGALGGIDAIPEAWVREVESASMLDRLARELHRVSLAGAVDGALDRSLDPFGAERFAVRAEDDLPGEDTVVGPMAFQAAEAPSGAPEGSPEGSAG